MRDPLRKAGYSLVLSALGAGGLILVTNTYDRLGETLGAIIGVVSLTVAVFSGGFLLVSLFAALGHARLLRGIGVIARWHVSAAEWDRFRAFDAIRSAQDHTLVNELGLRKRTIAESVEVVVGRRQLIVDGSYHALTGLPFLSAVYWLPAPADPECLEFALIYPAGRYGGTRRLSLRVPVPASSRQDGIRVYEHYHAIVPKPQLGIVFRRPQLVLGWCMAVAVMAAAVGGMASFMVSEGDQSDLTIFVALLGIAVAVAALLLIVVLGLAVWLRKR